MLTTIMITERVKIKALDALVTIEFVQHDSVLCLIKEIVQAVWITL